MRESRGSSAPGSRSGRSGAAAPFTSRFVRLALCRSAPLAVALATFPALPALARDAAGPEARRLERLSIDDVETGIEGGRGIALHLRALTRYGDPVEGLRAADLAIRDGDDVIEPEAVTLSSLADSGRGVTCVIALEASLDMKGEPFAQAKEAVLGLIDGHVERRDRVAIVAFSDAPRVVSGFGASLAEARSEVERLALGERPLGSAFHDGVSAGIALIRGQGDLPRRSFVIVFSAGRDEGSQRSLEQVIEDARGDGVRPPILVFTVGYARLGGEGLSALARLAGGTQADFLRASSTIQLPTLFEAAWRQMKHSYVVRYEAEHDDAPHALTVSIDGHTARRTARYTKVRAPIWPSVAVASGAVLLGVLVWLRAGRRAAGRLVFQSGPRAGEVVALRRGRLRIGAAPEGNDLVLPSETVSRHHAVIYCRSGRVEIEDLGSVNGTFVNGRAVRAAPLQPRDQLRLADVELLFER